MLTVWHAAILYSLRLMHKDAAGIATAMPMVNLVAE
jgi:hypothetical protein